MLNALTTVEMVVDFKTEPAQPYPITLDDSLADIVGSFWFLGSTISQDLKWGLNTGSLTRKLRKRCSSSRRKSL